MNHSNAAKKSETILQPAVAGRFYPDHPGTLAEEVKRYISEAELEPSNKNVVAVLTPHAGYPFSGPVAGYSFRYVQNQQADTVLFIALSHKNTEGGCVFQGEAFETPLGRIDVDHEFTDTLMQSGKPFHGRLYPYQGEHSVEVNLPFVQQTFPNAKIASVLVSRTEPQLCRSLGQRIAEAIKQHSKKSFLIVVSSDMSHFPDYETATKLDNQMLHSLESMDADRIFHDLRNLEGTPAPNLHCVMCGSAAMLTAVETALSLGNCKGKKLHYRNSGDSEFGDHDRVVGYGSFAIEKE